MRIFFAGASGVMGRRLLPQLTAAGHEVTAMTRSAGKAEAIRSNGVEAVVCDALDAAALGDCLRSLRPEAVIHQLTDLGGLADPRTLSRPRRLAATYAANDRLRREGTRNLVDAAVEAGARRMVAQSVAFGYAPGAGLRKEDDPLYHGAPAPFESSIAALEALEGAVTGTPEIEGLALRFGLWYGPGTGFARDGSYAELVRRRRFPIVGRGRAVYSFIHVDDAAAATAMALKRGAPGVYNVVDDDPAPMREWLPAYASAVGAKRPRRIPSWLVRLVAGQFAVHMGESLSGASNEKARRALAWEPRWQSWRRGFAEALG